MKNFKNIFSLIVLLTLTFSCTNEEKVAGTIAGNNLELVPLIGTIATTSNYVLTDQKTPITITLPKSFSDIVTVEVSSFSDTGRRRRTYIEIPANQTTINSFAAAAGGADGVYDGSKCTFVLSGISLKTSEPGKHYLLSSNELTLNTGDSSVPSANSSKLQIRLNWLYPNASDNNLNFLFQKQNGVVTSLITGASSNSTNITVSSTTELFPGMIVKVANVTGTSGNFNNNTVITAITSGTTFTVNRAPVIILSNATIIGYGNNYNDTNASSVAKEVTVTSTNGLYKGMVLFVMSGTGKFAANTVISEVLSSTTFTISVTPTTVLSGATIMASFADVLAPRSGDPRIHDISTAGTTNIASSSSVQGDYIFKIAPVSLISGTTSLPYRLVIVKPDGEVTVFNGKYDGITLASPFIDVLKVNKTGEGDAAVFTVTNLNPLN